MMKVVGVVGKFMADALTIKDLLKLSDYCKNLELTPFKCTRCHQKFHYMTSEGFVEIDAKTFVCYDCLVKDDCRNNG